MDKDIKIGSLVKPWYDDYVGTVVAIEGNILTVDDKGIRTSHKRHLVSLVMKLPCPYCQKDTLMEWQDAEDEKEWYCPVCDGYYLPKEVE